MLLSLHINENDRIKTLSKGTREKVQLILVMSRDADLYVLDEPIAGVDPAARDYILSTILNNYNPEGTVLISTHLISDVERVLDEVLFIQNGQIIRQELVDDIREKEGRSVDELFREVFRTVPFGEVNGNAWETDEIRYEIHVQSIYSHVDPGSCHFAAVKRFHTQRH